MQDFLSIFARFEWIDAIDILLVAVIFYGVLRLFAGTQGVQLLRGILVLVFLGFLASNFTGLTAFGWLVRNSAIAFLIAIPVIFQPELRRALERLGRSGLFFARSQRGLGAAKTISELVNACSRLAQLRYGAIIVLESQTGLEETVETGVRLHALVDADLLLTIFHPGTPLHDGAVILRGQKIEAAACVLPLTQRPLNDSMLGTRHRAALGITEGTDALAIVVSEETGILSAARNGRLVRRLDERRLWRLLEHFYEARTPGDKEGEEEDDVDAPLRGRDVDAPNPAVAQGQGEAT
ncbi:MAG: TIGR00159 family protein [Caldilineales bacterium]|nr:TIGR00159 family protein [Caldilineales bacterium]